MKTIRCNLTKACQIFTNSTEPLYYIRILGYFLKILKKFHLFIEELYACLYNWYMFEALNLLVYKRDPNSKGYSSIRILYCS